MSIIEEKKAIEELHEQHEIEKKLKKTAKKNKAEKTTTVDKKKGQKVGFKPAARLPKIGAPEGFMGAWKLNTPENVRRLQMEGWQVADRNTHNIDMDMSAYYRKVNDKPANEKESTVTHNECIYMVLDDETAEARRQYYREQTEEQTKSKLIPENNATNAAITNAARFKTNIEIN